MLLFQNQLFATPLRPYLFLMLLIICIWLPCIHDNYINVDTPWLVVENPILSDGNWASLPTILGDFSLGTRLTLGAEYLPVRDLTVLLDFTLFGAQWGWHHFHSLLWYLAGCLLFLGIGFNIYGQRTSVWLATAAFSLHPTHIESVAWLANRKDVVSMAFVMLAVLLYLQRQRFWWVAGVGIIAYWAKNTAIMLPPLLVVLSLLVHRDSPRKVSWWGQWIALGALFGVGLWITLYVGEQVHMFAQARGDTFLENLNIAAQSFGQYVTMLMFPTQLSLFYVEPTPGSWLNGGALMGLAFLFSITVLPLLCWTRSPMTSVALIWIGLGLLPVSQITPIQNLIADRYLLLPSAGVALLLMEHFPETKWNQQRYALLMVIWCVFLGWLTIERLPLFHSSQAIWTDVTQKQPKEPRGWTAMSGLYLKARQFDRAQATIEEGFVHLPHHPELMQSYGLIYLTEGKYLLAQKWLIQAWKGDNQLRKSANNLAILYQKTDNIEEARRISEELVLHHNVYDTGWNTLGSVCLGQGDLVRAREALERGYELNPYSTSIAANLGNLAYTEQKYAEAQYWWEQTLRIDPSHSHAQSGLKHLQTVTK